MKENNELSELIKIAKDLALNQEWGFESIKVNTKIIQLDPKCVGAYNRLAKCYIELSNYQMATLLYQFVLILDHENTISKNGLLKIDKLNAELTSIRVNNYEYSSVRYHPNSDYESHCYKCKRIVTSLMKRCKRCQWYICPTCGSCGCGFPQYLASKSTSYARVR